MTATPDPNEDEDALLAREFKALADLVAQQQAPAKADVPMATRARLEERRQKLHCRLSDAASVARDGHAKTTDRVVMDVPLSCISCTRIENIRLQEDELAFADLRESLKTDGQLQPIMVVPHPRRANHFQAFGGHRRLKAAQALGCSRSRSSSFPWTRPTKSCTC